VILWFLVGAIVGTTGPGLAWAQASSDGDVERYLDQVQWLADDAREGRGVGTQGLEAAGAWIAQRFEEIGLSPAGSDGYRHAFTVTLPDPANPHAEGESVSAFNVVGRLASRGDYPLPGVVVVGAHYDHLGYGGFGSLDPDSKDIHNGADDNASGTVALIETARRLAARSDELRRDVVFVAFSGEEHGLIGSSAFVRMPPAGVQVDQINAMINMDMVGRLGADRLQVLGGESAEEWTDIVGPLCTQLALDCVIQGDGFGSSDHSSFFAAGVPVLHLFTGAHSEYHRPSDDADLIDGVGAVRIVQLIEATVADLTGREAALTLVESTQPAPTRMRMGGARLGTIPDYAGPADGSPGLLLSAVRSGSPAEEGGLQRGDLIVRIDDVDVGGVEDFMMVLSEATPGTSAIVHVIRDEQVLELEVTYGGKP
jgi:hypothetical protein